MQNEGDFSELINLNQCLTSIVNFQLNYQR